MSSCAGPSRVTAPSGSAVMLRDAWYETRAKELGVSAEETRAKDETFSEESPPGEEQVSAAARVQAASIWAEQCSRCHGADGEPPEKTEHPGAPPRAWGTMGTSMGFFFGGDKMRAGIYRTIAKGGAKKEDGTLSAMPAWGDSFSREQLWALVYHIESF